MNLSRLYLFILNIETVWADMIGLKDICWRKDIYTENKKSIIEVNTGGYGIMSDWGFFAVI